MAACFFIGALWIVLYILKTFSDWNMFSLVLLFIL
jgi:hypothetical protein